MVMGLMHIHQLDTHYKRYGSRNSHSVIWGHGVMGSFSPKMLFLLQFTWHNNETQAYSSTWHSLQKLRVWKFTRGHLGSQGSNGNFQQKNGITCPCYIAWQLDSYMCICLNPSIYVKCQQGGIWRQILIFMLIAISPLCYIIKYSGRICVVSTTQRL